MIFLKNITFPSDDMESNFIWDIRETCFDSYYPFRTLAIKGLTLIDFDPLTVLYGGNGTGKTTALNVIAEKLSAQRGTVYNRTTFFADYVDMCKVEFLGESPTETRIITIDDVLTTCLISAT